MRPPVSYLRGMFGWLRRHPRLVDLAIVGSALALSLSLVEELGVALALGVGLLFVLFINIAIAFRRDSER
jgi:hypothetical protein